MGKKLPSLTILRDTREKKGWYFEDASKPSSRLKIDGTVDIKLDSGDYAIQGLEDKFIIERKAGLAELFNNYTPKSNRERFEREAERLRDIPHVYIIVESSLNEDLMRLSIPQMGRYGPPGKKVIQWLFELEFEYGIQTIWAGDCAQSVAKILFDRIGRMYL